MFFHVLSPPCRQKWLYIISRLLYFLYSIIVDYLMHNITRAISEHNIILHEPWPFKSPCVQIWDAMCTRWTALSSTIVMICGSRGTLFESARFSLGIATPLWNRSHLSCITPKAFRSWSMVVSSVRTAGWTTCWHTLCLIYVDLAWMSLHRVEPD